jgi:hypothetical protein
MRALPKWFWAVVVVLFAVPYFHTHHRSTSGAGPLVREEPSITAMSDAKPWTYKNYRIQPIAECTVRARVLSREPYYFDRGAKLSPLDLALGWRGMSDSTYLDRLTISQGSRWYFFRYPGDSSPLPDETISLQSKNVHIIPGNKKVAKRLSEAKPDRVIRLRGSLVRIHGPDDFTWASYPTVGGHGEGSCWVMWVDDLEVEG